jgi:hypothetical protein
MIEQREVAIKDLRISDEFQMRDELDLKRVARLADAYKAGDNVAAITLAQVDGMLILVDGFHRVAALKTNGWSDVVNAEIHKTTRQGALRMAARANLTPGKPVTPKERRKAFNTYIENQGHHLQGRVNGKRKPMKSYGTLARELGMAKTTVIRWMQEDFPKVAEVMGNTAANQWTGKKKNPSFTEIAEFKTREGLEAARVAFKGVTGKLSRGDLIHEAEELVQKMKAMGAYTKYKPSDEPPPF